MSANNQLISKVTIDGLTKDKIYDIQSAIFANMVKVKNDFNHDRFYNINLFKYKD